MHTCTSCQKQYTIGGTLWDKLCIECWINKFKVEPLTAERLRNGESINQVNCSECKCTNRAYCSKCVD